MAWGWWQPPGSWVLVTSANKLNGVFQNNSFHHQFYDSRTNFSKWLLPVSLSPGQVQVSSYLSRRISKNSRWIWPRSILNNFLCTGPWNKWDFACAHKHEVLFSWSSLALQEISPSSFHSQTYQGLISWYRTSRLGSLIWASDHVAYWGGEPLWLWYFSHLWVTNLVMCFLTIPHIHSPTRFFFFVLSCVKYFF